MKLTCSKCQGNKTYRGMGSMIIKCEPCKGLGQIETDDIKEPIAEKKASKKPRKGLNDEESSRSGEAE